MIRSRREEERQFQYAQMLVLINRKVNRYLGLHELNLRGNAINDQGIRYLLKQKFPYVSKIDLGLNNLSGAFLEEADFPSLKQISLNDNSISNQGLKMITRHNWKAVQEIRLEANQISNNGALVLFLVDEHKYKTISCKDNKIFKRMLLDSHYREKNKDKSWLFRAQTIRF